LARTSTWSCTPDFCQRNLHIARIRRFNFLHKCGRTKAIGEFCGPAYCPARAQRAAIWLDRCTAPALHSADGIFCKLRPSLLHPIRSAHTNQQSTCSASKPNPCSWGRIRVVDKVRVPISDETARGRTYASSLDRRLQRMGAKNLQDRIAHGIGPDSRIHFPTTITPVSEKPMTIPWLALPFLTIESCDYSTHSH